MCLIATSIAYVAVSIQKFLKQATNKESLVFPVSTTYTTAALSEKTSICESAHCLP